MLKLGQISIFLTWLFLSISPSMAEEISIDRIMQAAIDQRERQVARTYSACVNERDIEYCKDELKKIHKRELIVISTIYANFGKYNSSLIANAFNACSSIHHDYSRSTSCKERLSKLLESSKKIENFADEEKERVRPRTESEIIAKVEGHSLRSLFICVENKLNEDQAKLAVKNFVGPERNRIWVEKISIHKAIALYNLAKRLEWEIMEASYLGEVLLHQLRHAGHLSRAEFKTLLPSFRKVRPNSSGVLSPSGGYLPACEKLASKYNGVSRIRASEEKDTGLFKAFP
ncbi:hypothetical protein [Cohaesibacter intestini]|uniref:hypothetical protein n=1 Tax=Cohaesibacter intestini TaxID=2211145 RepID=UPI000DEB7C73|nr:hypothetical protein [Cohaesibacter intestini]